jgi:hypothetical protein
LAVTSYLVSMAVNALVTGLIVFKILEVFLEVKATSVEPERTLGTTVTGGPGTTKLRHVIFIIIESGMALLAIQVLRVVVYFLGLSLPNYYINFVIVTNQMLNVIISLFICTSFVLLTRIIFTWLGHHTNNNFGAGHNEIVLRRPRILQGSYWKSSF